MLLMFGRDEQIQGLAGELCSCCQFSLNSLTLKIRKRSQNNSERQKTQNGCSELCCCQDDLASKTTTRLGFSTSVLLDLFALLLLFHQSFPMILKYLGCVHTASKCDPNLRFFWVFLPVSDFFTALWMTQYFFFGDVNRSLKSLISNTKDHAKHK